MTGAADPGSVARWQRVSQAFDALSELHGSEREAALARWIDADPEIGREAAALLAADARGDAVVDRRGSDWIDPETFADGDPTPPDVGPRYQLVERIGSGGMGDVWRALRHDAELTHHVAIKLLKRGTDSDALRRRFRSEQHILARLSHPGICGLIDTGTAVDGRPFLAMELIAGTPLVAYADRERLDLNARLKLLIETARIVDYAHRQLVVHRDLKPSNILVDAEGHPRVLDFGIAKLIEPSAAGDTIGSGLRALSAAYAAPEQILGQHEGIATDVYALGVIAYELITGTLPHRRGGSLERLIAELPSEKVTLPSKILDALPADGSAPHRSWRRRVRCDLDLIVTCALHADAARRYPTAAAFADDLQRWLEERPVLAQRDSVAYRAGKFLDRHRIGVAMAAIALAALCASLVLALWQAGEARRQAEVARALAEQSRRDAEHAQAVTDFLTRTMMRSSPYDASQGAPVRNVRDLVRDAHSRLGDELAEQPAAIAELQVTLGLALFEFGDTQPGLESQRRGIATLRSLKPDSAVLASALKLAAIAHSASGQLEAAQAYGREALVILEQPAMRSRGRATDLDRIQVRGTLINILRKRGDVHGAHAANLALLEERRRLPGDNRIGLAADHNNLAASAAQLSRHREARDHALEALALMRGSGHERSLRAANTLRGLATALMNLGELDEAERQLQKSAAIIDASVPDDHIERRFAHAARHRLLIERHLDDDQLPALMGQYRTLIAAIPEGHPARLAYETSYARIALRSGQLESARDYIDDVLARTPADTEIPSPQMLLMRGLSAALQALGDDAVAAARLDAVRAEIVAHGYADTDASAELDLALALVLQHQGDTGGADALRTLAAQRQERLRQAGAKPGAGVPRGAEAG